MLRSFALLPRTMVPAATLLVCVLASALLAAPPRLRVSENQHYLTRSGGRPFFYLGDTAWELFHRLDREEATLYLENRARKGFTVIQAVALAELDGLNRPNPYGHRPLLENDPTRPDVKPGPQDDYWDHVDFIVEKAESLGLFTGMLPTWGDKWNKKWGVGPVVFNEKNAEVYGEFLGKRYRDRAIIWILGGDRNPESEEHLAIIRAMARGLEKGDGGSHLMTYHPQGGASSATWFHEDEWLDFNMFQSGHGKKLIPNHEVTLAGYRLSPVKPILDGEPCYEDHPVGWKPENGWFDAWDVRKAAYSSMLCGACGHTYGDHNIWQMWEPGRAPISSARTPWQKALDHPASFQIRHLRRLFEARPYHRLVPDQELLASDPGRGEDHVRAARASDGSFALVYVPTGKPVTVRLKKLSGEKVKAGWFDPRQPAWEEIGEFPRRGEQRFESSSQGRGNDWVLVLEDAGKRFAALP